MNHNQNDISLKWWEIRGFGDPGWNNKYYWSLERKGNVGFCISGESSFERKRMLAWLRTNTTFLSWGRLEYCAERSFEIGSYQIPSRCVWIDPQSRNAFEQFMNTLVAREHLFLCNNLINPIVKNMLRGINHKVIPSRTYSDKGYLSVQNFDKIEHLRFLLAITREPEQLY